MLIFRSNALGPTHSAQLVMYSLDFHPVARLELEERWTELAALLIEAIARVERAGADFVVLASNTAHKAAESVQASIHIPLIHIADVAADTIVAAGLSTVGLLGTRFVMEQDFYRQRLHARGIEVLVPEPAGRDYVHDVIYNELCTGKLDPRSKENIQALISDLQRAGAEGVVLACTELPLLVRPEETPVRLFDTLAMHVNEAVNLALASP